MRTNQTTILWDVGGVILTNGWDRDQRSAAATHFGMNGDELEVAHAANLAAFETGQLTLDDYLRRVVFQRPRGFTAAAFRDAMFAMSQPLPGMLDLVAELAGGRGRVMATVNNEGRELNQHRIDAFGLARWFTAFCSSCYTGVRKPENEAWVRALGILQAAPAECVFIDDRAGNVAAAAALGIDSIQFESEPVLRRQLLFRGLL